MKVGWPLSMMTPPSDHNGSTAALPQASGDTEKTSPAQVEYRFYSPQLPLAVYREVAAHLQQIDGVTTGLLPQTAKTFDYLQSQVGGLWVRYSAAAADHCQPQIEAILTHYGDRYGHWETLSQ